MPSSRAPRRVARLSSHGLAERLADVEQPQQLLARLKELEALR